MSTIEINNLHYTYPNQGKSENKETLKGINLSINAGEIFGFLGPNGSGKTTLFKIVSTLMPPTKGTVLISGGDIINEPDNARNLIGVVFQNPSLDKKLTISENLTCQGHLYGMYGATLKKKISSQLEKFDLSDRSKEFAEKLSGGLKRQVELAKGLLHKPKILVLDEPSTGLDLRARRKLWKMLINLSREDGVTLLITTHLTEEAELCDRLTIMNQGELVVTGTPHELKKEIGGDIITVSTSNPEGIAEEIKNRFKVNPVIVKDMLRIELSRGQDFIKEILEDYSDKVSSIKLGKPTLEDVFIKKTGKSFW